MDPATIIEQRDTISFLHARGFNQLLEAINDPACQARGKFSARAMARCRNIPRQKIDQMIRAARDTLATSTTRRSPLCS
jgi:hypothetical protein